MDGGVDLLGALDALDAVVAGGGMNAHTGRGWGLDTPSAVASIASVASINQPMNEAEKMQAVVHLIQGLHQYISLSMGRLEEGMKEGRKDAARHAKLGVGEPNMNAGGLYTTHSYPSGATLWTPPPITDYPSASVSAGARRRGGVVDDMAEAEESEDMPASAPHGKILAIVLAITG